jgi:oxaloacetate decarboxylase alpha subunit
MLAAPPAPRHYNPGLRPVISLLQQLAGHRELTQVSVEKPGFRLELRRHAHPVRSRMPP